MMADCRTPRKNTEIMMFDPKCYDLAKYFLHGETPNASHSLDELAQEIQDAVEDYLIGKREAAEALSR